MNKAYIIDAVRTPRAKKKGKFSKIHPVDLASLPLNALLNRNRISANLIEDVVLGCVTQTNEQSWCIARSAILAAGWPDSIPGATVNRLCASGQQAVSFIASTIESGRLDLGIAGGVEHMTRVPMFSDSGGETSPLLKKYHPDLVPQGLSAELLTEKFKISREKIDNYALRSQQLASLARTNGYFKKSILPVNYSDDSGEHLLDFDDNIRPETTIEGLRSLKPAFKENGSITAGNASAIVDGAGALLLASEASMKNLNLKPRAEIVSYVQIGSDPKIMLSGPIEASKLALKKSGLKIDEIDLWEINEAFAPVVIATMESLEIDPSKVNVNGGGISLGHPLGATGAMLIGMAVDELERQNKKYALITMCIGLGMGTATIIKRV